MHVTMTPVLSDAVRTLPDQVHGAIHTLHQEPADPNTPRVGQSGVDQIGWGGASDDDGCEPEPANADTAAN